MKNDSKQNIREKIISYFKEIPEVQLVYLYGSLAKDRAGEHSDIDIAIAGSQKFSAENMATYTLQLDKLLQREIDLVDMYLHEGLLLKEILTTGDCLIRRDIPLQLRFIQKLYSFTEDYEPLYRKMLSVKLQKFLSV